MIIGFTANNTYNQYNQFDGTTRTAPLEEKSLDGKKWYVLDLEGKVKPGDYMLTTEESDVCSILSGDFKIEPGPYKLMLIEACGTLFLN